MTGKHLVNVEKWIAENEKAFLPPVCNKLMHFSQLNIMFVGGPNTRKDYHIEEGEELFYQVKGDMCLKVVENGKHKDVHIREGEMFLLPARVPHSPQRQANTVGLVVERRRLRSETDCLRYYVEGTTEPLFEKWFYCEDLGTQLVPVIQEFFASEQYRTGKPNPDEVFREPPFHMNTMHVMTPFNFREWVDTQRPSLVNGHPMDMFGSQFETETFLYGPGQTEASRRDTDVWIWQQVFSKSYRLSNMEYVVDLLLCPLCCRYQWRRTEGSIALFVVQNPERKRT
uniref:3-hydroxyanthranilate 3,4-dioxygenase n=1 Tax=Esox lucius TaxID=8010 RepID=A0A3P9A7P8_ESOLU